MSDEAPDLFGHEPAQDDLFAAAPPRNNGVGVADPNEVRRRLHRLLAEAEPPRPSRRGASAIRACIKSPFHKWRAGYRMPRPSSCA